MNPTPTGVAVALAVAVAAIFFVVPGLSPFMSTVPSEDQTASTLTTNALADTAQTTTMPSEPTQPTTPLPAFKELQMKDEVVGTGATAAAGDTVTVQYVGVLTNNKVFDASANHGTEGFTFQLGVGQVIKGWDLGVVGMKEGGKRILAIPAALAYGNRDLGAIPPNSDLIFEVELVKVQKKAQ